MPELESLLENGIRHQTRGDLERALEAYRECVREARDPQLVSEAWRRQASVLRCSCAWEEAIEAARRAVATAREAGLADAEAEALNAEGAVHLTRGDLEPAIPLFEAARDTALDPRVRGLALQNLGTIAAQRGHAFNAEQYYRESCRCFQQAGYARGEALVLTNYAASALDRGDLDLAERLGEQAVQSAMRLEDLEVLAIARKNSAETMLRRGKYERAEELASAALGYFSVGENAARLAECYELLGDIRARQGDKRTAQSCYERGRALAERIGAEPIERRMRDRLRGLVRSGR
jgi:eukaryotic-like serine/threonine-protein kinase